MKGFKGKKRAGGKIDYMWIGPYEITSTLRKGLYKVKAVQSDKVRCRVE